MVVGFTSASCVVESRSWRGVLDTTLCDKVSVYQWFVAREVGGFLWVLHFPPPVKLTATL